MSSLRHAEGAAPPPEASVVGELGAEPGQHAAIARMARGSTANLVGAVVTAVCTFGLTIAVTRGVSRADAGVFFSVTSLFLVATTIGQLGTQTSLVYFVSRSRVAGSAERSEMYLRSALRAVTGFAIVIAVLVLVLARPLAELTCPHHVGQATTYLRVLAPFVPLAGCEQAVLSATRGMGSMRPNTVIEQILRPLGQLLLVIAATSVASSALLGLAWSVAYVPATVAAFFAWRSLRPRAASASSQRTERRVISRELWKFSLPRALTSVLQMLMQRFDIVLVGALSGAVNAAIYAAATRFIVVGQLGTNALTLAAQPQLAAHLSTGDDKATNELYQTSTAWLILVTWPLYFVMIIFAEPLLRVFGHGYTTGQAAILLIAFSMLIATGLGLVDTILAMAGHTSWNLGNAALALSTNIGLDIWLIPRHGIVGAAIGWAVAIVVRNVAALVQVALRLGHHPFSRQTAVAAVLTTAWYLGLLAGVRAVFGATGWSLLLGVLAATAGYLVTLWVLRGPLRLDALAALRRTPAVPIVRKDLPAD